MEFIPIESFIEDFKSTPEGLEAYNTARIFVKGLVSFILQKPFIHGKYEILITEFEDNLILTKETCKDYIVYSSYTKDEFIEEFKESLWDFSSEVRAGEKRDSKTI